MNGNEAIGELVNRGPHHFEGYWRNPAADAARRREGWYWTGDLFYRDADGSCTSPAGPTTGSASTARTWPPR